MRRYFVTFGSAIVAVCLALVIIGQNGSAWRIPQDRYFPSSREMRDAESALCNGTDNLNGEKLGTKPGQPLVTCSREVGAIQNIYVWGDSHARHLLGGLATVYPNYNIRILYYTSCQAQNGIHGFEHDYKGQTVLSDGCRKRNTQALEYFVRHQPTKIILHQYFGYEGQFSDNWYQATQKIFDTLKANGHRVAFIGGVPRPGVGLSECLTVPATISNSQLSRRCAGDRKSAANILAWNTEISGRFPENFIDISGVFCSAEGFCRGVNDGVLLFRDKHHLSLAGARRLLTSISRQLSEILNL